MAQAILLPTPAMPHFVPASPDPTPLRMLAFSVAEAALSSDPNSPLFFAEPKVASAQRIGEASGAWEEAFKDGWKEWNAAPKPAKEKRSKVVWDVLERAKGRKDKNTHFIENTSTTSPPVSPGEYNFILPANSQLAAAIARHQEHEAGPARLPARRPHVPLYTRSAEPSPIKSSFSGLDQTRPPPEFVPRLTAQEFVQQAKEVSADIASVRERRRSSIEPVSAIAGSLDSIVGSVPPRASRRSSRLPSLQQIQAKISGTTRLRRSGSVGAFPRSQPSPAVKERPPPLRMQSRDSVESLEVLQTPSDEVSNPLRDRRLALQVIMNRRPPTPPSPSGKEARLSSFLRERTNGRLAGVTVSASGLKIAADSHATPEKVTRPVLRVTPPSLESRPAVPPLHLGRATQVSPTKTTFPFRSGYCTPTESRFAHSVAHLATPPSRSGTPSPASPTASIRSNGSSAMNGSPTLSIPTITCTPAPPVILRDGFEQDSDDGSETSGDVMLFDGGAEERDREERERRGMEMRAKLQLRRRSSE